MHPLPSETRVVGRSVRVSEDKLRDWIPAEKVERTYTFGELRETFDNDGDGSLVIILLNEVERLQAALYVEQEAHAALQCRCFEGFPSVSDGIFDAYRDAQRDLEAFTRHIGARREKGNDTY